ncbi:MAG: hypothetical protein D8M58_21305 [Calditrichaeota bacterium]|nr:MAG: hypothetical protein DWQ03_00030 [Calditrichota bacterium]MBL1207951.1 hypothetical protein [Calditrichota bacterium]NOG47788.1 hypothetical protein [Calditrichota bacterium]
MSKEHEKSIQTAQEENRKNGKRGNVAVAKKPHFRSKGIKTHPRRKGYKNIDVTSGGPARFKGLSPMLLGPTSSTPQAQNMENLWQFSKVFKGEIDQDGQPTEAFFDRRNKGFADTVAHRRVKSNELYLFHYWRGRKLNYTEAREEIYVKNYSELVRESQVYKELLALLDEGMNLQIIGYDGRDYDATLNQDGKQLNKWLRDLSRPFGHELVLAGLLAETKGFK